MEFAADGNKEAMGGVNDNTLLPVERLSVRARHVFDAMPIPKTYGGIRTVTYDMVLGRPHAGAKTAQEIMEFRDACLDGKILPRSLMPTQNIELPSSLVRADDPLPQPALATLSNRTRNILDKHGIRKTPRGICELDRETIRGLRGAGDKVVDELLEFKKKCLDGSVWEFEEHEPVEEDVHPDQFSSLSEYVMAALTKTVLAKMCWNDARKERIIADYIGLFNVEKENIMTLRELGDAIGVSGQTVSNIADRIKADMSSVQGRAVFADYVQRAEAMFAQGNGVVREGCLAAGLNDAFGWTGTTEFSALRLLEYCGVKIEKNDSGCMAWMTGGLLEAHYQIFVELLENKDVPLESLAMKAVLQNAGLLELDGMTEDEYRFLLCRVREHRLVVDGKARWDIFLRNKCGLGISESERRGLRRAVVAKALYAAGMKGLSHPELVVACREIDPDVDIGDEASLSSDAMPNSNADMDGAGAGLIVYDYVGNKQPTKFSLDVFFKTDELLRSLKEAGERLRAHMEKNGLGAMAITRLVNEIKDRLPEPYSEGLPSGCVYSLMRKYGIAGLKYYDHPNVAHPAIIEANGGKVPEQAKRWVAYEYFEMCGRETATNYQMLDFCEFMLGMDRKSADGQVLPAVMEHRKEVKGTRVGEYLPLKPPDDKVDPPKVLLEGGEFDSELSFSTSGGPQQMHYNFDGKALDLSTYVRDFLLKLEKSSYSFTADEEVELADPGWCGMHLGYSRAAFLRVEPNSGRPNANYWRRTYRVGRADYWVCSIWRHKDKCRFDKWAQAVAERAGFAFEAYEIPDSAEA